MSGGVRGRFAPSPSGPLHLGTARTALLAWLHARAQGGVFILRIEDLDPQRSRPEYEHQMLDDLRWLGLDWDEGPDVGGPHGPYRQSECHARYRAVLQRLEAYPCSCSRREVREASSAPHGREPRYPGICRSGPKNSARPMAWRWRTPAGVVTYEDDVLGPRSEDVRATIGDFVLRRADDAWAYQLAVVADDEAMGITDVVRGEDLEQSTARQILLRRALGYSIPRHAHVPLLLTPDGAKRSKRDGVAELEAIRKSGADPQVVVARLAASAGIIPTSVERVEPRQLIREFSWDRIRRHGERSIVWGT